MSKSHTRLVLLAALTTALIGSAKYSLSLTPNFHKKILPIATALFKPTEGSPLPIKVGALLADQMKEKNCCSGRYIFSINTSDIPIQQPATSEDTNAIYLSSVGGIKRVYLNGQELNVRTAERSSVGPILAIPSTHLAYPKLLLEVEIDSPNLMYAGFWRSHVYVGPLNELEELRDANIKTQVLIPIFDATVAALLSLIFYTIHTILKKRASYFRLFAFVLGSWAAFFLSLSGVFRNVDYHLGSLIHFPIRTLAGYFSFRLCEKLLGQRHWRPASYITMGVLIMELLSGVYISQTSQSHIFIFSSLIGFVPLFRHSPFIFKSQLKTPFFLYSIFLLGQTSDAIKMMAEKFSYSYSVPYLNRYSLLPFLAFSFVFALIKFSETFKNLNLQLFRMRQISIFGARLSRDDPSNREFDKIASKLKRLLAADFCYASEETAGGPVFLNSSASENAEIPKELHSIEFRDFENPQIVDKINLGRLYIVPVRIADEKKKTLILLKKDYDSEGNGEISFVSQAINIFRTSTNRTNERKKREASEARFRKLIQKLDPNLYEYVDRNESLLDTSDDSSRGIIFFDQKGYSTLLENLDERSAYVLAETVNRWVAEKTAKYGARICNFNGDAYTVEIRAFPGEGTPNLCVRICNLVWELSQSLDELNRKLLCNGLEPITFRFGAHIGKASGLKLDFISPGLSNMVGDNVNIASRLQSMARPGCVLVSGELVQEIKNEYVFRKIPRSYVKGRRRELEVFELVGRIEQDDGAGQSAA